MRELKELGRKLHSAIVLLNAQENWLDERTGDDAPVDLRLCTVVQQSPHELDSEDLIHRKAEERSHVQPQR